MDSSGVEVKRKNHEFQTMNKQNNKTMFVNGQRREVQADIQPGDVSAIFSHSPPPPTVGRATKLLMLGNMGGRLWTRWLSSTTDTTHILWLALKV